MDAKTVDAKTTAQFGALPTEGGVRFRVWAPAARDVTLVLHDGAAAGAWPMGKDDDGVHDRTIKGAAPGHRYSYLLDGGGPLPDPASRFQPDGVHGWSEVIDPAAFAWTDGLWQGHAARDLVVYELHIGTFSPEGTFDGAARRLPALRDLGVTAIEIMPVADFAGMRNWGYDGVALFAPSRAYGRPDDLRRLVDEAHRLGLSVILDVVYNHIGPEGAYLTHFNPGVFSDRHVTPWGRGINLDGPGAPMVRRFILENAQHWVREYHVDGLRLDATHALVDDSPVHIVAELAEAVRACGRSLVLHAEDHRNLTSIVEARARGGWALDGVWADDFHHVVRRLLAGDAHSYYADFEGCTPELARTVRQGWLYAGQPSRRTGQPRGTDASSVPMRSFVVCLQNHDQIGNRAVGDRIHHNIPLEAWRAASVLLLTTPMTPLLFMGQEWAASTPFAFFTDLEPTFGALVTLGRRQEFADFPEFCDPVARERIPDPQAPSTFDASRLRWDEREHPDHAGVLALYRALLSLRRTHAALGASDELAGDAFAADDDSLIVRRTGAGEVFWAVVRFRGAGAVNLAAACGEPLPAVDSSWVTVLSTEDAPYATSPRPIRVEMAPEGPVVRFERAGAVILKEI